MTRSGPRITGLPELYAREIAARGFEADAAQTAAVARLDALRRRVLAENSGGVCARWRQRWGAGLNFGVGSRAHVDPRGVYLWGGVGRGKTWLMDLFFDMTALRARRRSHFHHFMHDVHAQLRQIRRRAAPLDLVAQRIARNTRLLCFDELYIADIADAMILGTLFEGLLRRGVMLVITSNVPPQQLYRDGLQRSRFLPAIELLEKRLEVVAVDGGIDYRLRQLRRRPIYLDSAAADTPAQLAQLFEQLADPHAQSETHLQIQGRTLRALRRSGDVVWFSFAALCEGPRSQNDYAEIASEFHTIVLSDVPLFMDPQQDNAARRFIALVDELYDRGIKLALSAAAMPEQLYRAERLQFEFRRTASRLAEMQSETYLASARRG